MNSYFKKYCNTINKVNEVQLKIEFGGIMTGGEYKQEFLNLADDCLYEITITRNELKLKEDELKEKILHKIQNEKVRV